MSHQIFVPPQVKQSKIFSNKHDIYEFSHELSNDLGLSILANGSENLKTSYNYNLMPSPPPKN